MGRSHRPQRACDPDRHGFHRRRTEFPRGVCRHRRVKLALADILAEAKKIAPDGAGDAVSQRLQRAKEYHQERRSLLQYVRQQRWNNSPPSAEACLRGRRLRPCRKTRWSSRTVTRTAHDRERLDVQPEARDLYATEGGVLGWACPPLWASSWRTRIGRSWRSSPTEASSSAVRRRSGATPAIGAHHGDRPQ